jgi:menaquinone-9 beta-reductase
MSKDVIVVGAGPAGAAAAIELAKGGASVLVLDRSRFPRDKTCGSGLSPTAVALADRLGIGGELRNRAYRIDRVKIVTPRGRSIVLASNAAAVVLLRRELDDLLIRRACSLGATFLDGVRATALLRDGARVSGVRTAGAGDLRGRYVVCADGAHSVFSIDRRPKQTIGTLMGWWEDVDHSPGQLEMMFDPELVPLYGWLFPETDRRVNIGICMEGQDATGRKPLRNVRQLFARFLDRHFTERLLRARPVGGLRGHPIVFTPWVDHCAAPGALYIGEAARVSNYATGEGISQAMQSGVFAAESLTDVLRGRRSEEQAFARYVWRSRTRFGSERLVAASLRAAVRAGVLDCIAAAHENPYVRRAVVHVLGSALAGSSVRSPS